MNACCINGRPPQLVYNNTASETEAIYSIAPRWGGGWQCIHPHQDERGRAIYSSAPRQEGVGNVFIRLKTRGGGGNVFIRTETRGGGAIYSSAKGSSKQATIAVFYRNISIQSIFLN